MTVISDFALDQYQEDAMRTHVSDPIRLPAYALGLSGEAGEVADLVKKHIGHGHDLDVNKLKLELGDVLWYIAGLAHVLGLTLSEVAEANVAKLKRRYPDGFSHEASKNRSE
jgi:NTP pyrophosphatase (non-canonical NTP hydrolase)